MKSIFGFDAMLTPKILVVIYWLSMLFILGVGVYSVIFDNPIYAAFGTIGGLIGCRMCFELIMIAFKNNEYLRRIAESNNS
jgi:predicted ferric reductase